MLYYFFPFYFSLSNKSLIYFTYIYYIWWYQKQSWLKRCQDQRNVLRNWVSLFVKQHCLSSWTFPGALLVTHFVSCLFLCFHPYFYLPKKKNKKSTKKNYIRVMVEDLTEKYCNEYIRRWKTTRIKTITRQDSCCLHYLLLSVFCPEIL